MQNYVPRHACIHALGRYISITVAIIVMYTIRVLSRNEFLEGKMVRGKYALGRGLRPFPPGKC